MHSEQIVKVIEKNTENVLFSCSIEESEKAYAFARELEELGIEVELTSPSVTTTLANALGVDEINKAKLQASIEHELLDHDGQDCCK